MTEPALAEALKAFVARYYTVPCLGAKPSLGSVTHFMMCQQTNQVLNTAIERIAASNTYTDELLETILVMALDATLIGDQQAWATHMSGSTQVVAARHRLGMIGLSLYFVGQLILLVFSSCQLLLIQLLTCGRDSINDIFDFPRIFYMPLVTNIPRQSCDALDSISKLTKALKSWRQLRRGSDRLSHKFDAAEKLWIESFIYCRALLLHANPFVRAAAQAAETILYLSSQKCLELSEAQRLAKQLKYRLSCVPITCAVIEFTSVPIWLGAVLSQEGTATRAWFVNRLSQGMKQLQYRCSDVILKTLKRELAVFDGRWLTGVDDIWNELQHADNHTQQ